MKTYGVSVAVFLIGDAAPCTLAGQTTPTGYHNLDRMLKILRSKGAQISVYGTCMDGQGIKIEMLAEAAHRSTMDELAAWRAAAERHSDLLMTIPSIRLPFGAHP